MAELNTSYLGFELEHPLVPGASPLTDELDGVRRLHDAGAPMFTLRSLIAAPLNVADEARRLDAGQTSDTSPSVAAGLQDAPRHAREPDAYCEHIRRVRRAIGDRIPIVASLYARSMNDWLSNANLIEQAGADALELNIYGMAISPDQPVESIQREILHVVQAVRSQIRLPIVVKLLPFSKSLDQFIRKLPAAGADALVLYNGFYCGDLGVDPLADPVLQAISNPLDPHYRLRWLARLSGGIGIDLAYGGGVRIYLHAIKALLCGAAAVQVVSMLIKNGPQHLLTMCQEMRNWLDEHDYGSVAQLQGQVSMQSFDTLESFDMTYNRQILMHPH